MAEDKPLKPWGPEAKLNWFLRQEVQRSYADDVLARLDGLRRQSISNLRIEQYGHLTLDPARFPLFVAHVESGPTSKPNILITGGVHGYETSGVKGALGFLEEHAQHYADAFNFVIAPCISPWSYETINRLDPIMENPNREFKKGGLAEESRLLMAYLGQLGIVIDGHMDLHETTDSDKCFLPEEYAKNGLALEADSIDIPDGYYLIGVIGHERPELEEAIVRAVRDVTHIAQADAEGEILGKTVRAEGIIHEDIPGLCALHTAAVQRLGAFTTEMYPDSPRYGELSGQHVEEICNAAQIASIRGALDFWKNHNT